ncbi:hypothetical protein BS50DRAFT_629931 [Corynespora cassiicola Philippines]|uniref:Uncharacterized protein n=1 Tax=Corynespora cassiicola Philippines TaxID=1448308 RepID=A0A2T2P299_CORCC|nr:hypothetical protein BS50DRAFT_629931 [Corynespora cassiicola Philippines]
MLDAGCMDGGDGGEGLVAVSEEHQITVSPRDPRAWKALQTIQRRHMEPPTSAVQTGNDVRVPLPWNLTISSRRRACLFSLSSLSLPNQPLANSQSHAQAPLATPYRNTSTAVEHVAWFLLMAFRTRAIARLAHAVAVGAALSHGSFPGVAPPAALLTTQAAVSSLSDFVSSLCFLLLRTAADRKTPVSRARIGCLIYAPDIDPGPAPP